MVLVLPKRDAYARLSTTCGRFCARTRRLSKMVGVLRSFERAQRRLKTLPHCMEGPTDKTSNQEVACSNHAGCTIKINDSGLRAWRPFVNRVDGEFGVVGDKFEFSLVWKILGFKG